MRRLGLILLGIALILGCFGYLFAAGRTYDYEVQLPAGVETMEGIHTHIDQKNDSVRLRGWGLSDGVLRLILRGNTPGKAYVDVSLNGEYIAMERFYVHPLGVITRGSYFGPCTGGFVIPLASTIYVAALLVSLVRKYRADVRENLYQYRNVLELGLIVFLVFLLIGQVRAMLRFTSLEYAVRSALGTASTLSTLLLPIAFVLSILITVSNLRLMRREGRTWRNMLGCFLGVLLCVGTLAPSLLGEWLQRTTLVDVHNEAGAAMYVELIVEETVYAVVAYLECILLGTVLFGFKAARHVPEYNKDYMLILGCQIRKDGTLTKLLQSRVDRAVAFAERQEAETGKQLVFVPSGGQGSDEAISEAEAMRRYLVKIGVPDSRILPETESKNTEENIRNSVALIRSRPGGDKAKLAFSTTNYHVFRAGLVASQQGVRMEGVGAPTKRYFWINAFVREFIATLYAERRTHILVVALLLLLTYGAILIRYLSVVL